MYNSILSTTIIFLLSQALNAQINWQKLENNPVLVPGGPGQSVSIFRGQVLYFDGEYKFWYGANDNGSGSLIQTFFASSSDGINWNKLDGPVLALGDSGEWDERNAMMPSIIYEDSVYKMWYVSRSGGATNGKIGYAESVDGINWTRHFSNPIMEAGNVGDADELGILSPWVLHHDGIYKMWYTGINADVTHHICYATSTDGINWTKSENNPVLPIGENEEFDSWRIHGASVLLNENGYHMWYGGRSISAGGRIGYAHSSDGLNWTKWGTIPVLSPDESTWEGNHMSVSTVMDMGDGRLKMWYLSGVSPIFSVGYAISTREIIHERHILGIPPTHWIAGDTVPVPLVMNRVTAVAGIDFAVVYDTTLLSFVSYDNSDVTSDFIFEVNSSIPGSLAVSMASSTALSATDRLHSIIGEMSFLIAADAQPADTAFIDFTSAALADTGGSPIRVSTVDGFVTVPIDGDVNLDGHISSGDAVIALRSAIGAHAPSDIEFIMADRDTNGVINELDAMCLLRLAVGLDCDLLGGSSGVTLNSYSPYISGSAGQIIEVEILFEGAIDLAAGSFDLLIPENLIKVNAVHAGDMEDNLLISSNRSGDNFTIGFVHTDGVSNSEGSLMILSLELLQDLPGMSLMLSGNRLFNESGQNMEMSVITGIEGEDAVNPESFRLEQNYPNPFNPVTSIGYFLPSQGHVLLTVYNMRGEEVIRLVDEVMSSGYHSVLWNALNSASGIYFYSLQTGDFVNTKKMVLVK